MTEYTLPRLPAQKRCPPVFHPQRTAAVLPLPERAAADHQPTDRQPTDHAAGVDHATDVDRATDVDHATDVDRATPGGVDLCYLDRLPLW